MADIRVRNLSQEAAESCYEAYLKGERPKEGTILVSGPVVVFTSDTFEMKGETLEDGEEKFVSILDNEAKSRAALCEYKNGRRLPAGAALAAMKEGYFAFQSEYMNEEGTPFTLSFDPLEEVMTAQEAGKLYGIPAKNIEKDCESAGLESPLKQGETRHSGNVCLLQKSAAERAYADKEGKTYAVNPLLLVFSTVEGADIWNRDSGVVRSAAGGAGHMSARMHEEERKKSGRVWLVTRSAMERLFGQALPNKMKEAMKGI